MIETVHPINFHLHGETGKLSRNIAEKWLIGLYETNPVLLEIFRDRDLKPYRELLLWSGEFAGKYITGAYYIYLVTRDTALYDDMIFFIGKLLECQSEDGYMGCFRKECRLTGAYSQNPSESGLTWDAWSHYHIMFGLYLWYHLTGNQHYFDAVLKAADLFLNTFYNGKKRLVSIGSTEMNLSVYHMFAILYHETKEHKYLSFALEIEKDLSEETAGNYINHSLSGLEFYACPKPRWESLHVILGIAEMYKCTGDAKYLNVAKQIFYSILKTDVHNTGGFSTDEAAIGHPFKNAAIETCCVVAYNALGLEIFKQTGDPKIVDFLELSLFNAVMGSFTPSGRWSTYNTPMEGTKWMNCPRIHFQRLPGSPDLSCCSVNAPRGVGMLSQWALMEEDGTVFINYFESFSAEMASGLSVEVTGDYPAGNSIEMKLNSIHDQKVAIRIPGWSTNTVVRLNGEIQTVQAGKYLFVEKTWNQDLISIQFDFSPRFIDGDMDYKGKKSIYKGPILYGYDLPLNPTFDFENIPPIMMRDIEKAVPQRMTDGSIHLQLDHGVVLSDFYHLGQTGHLYKTWLAVK